MRALVDAKANPDIATTEVSVTPLSAAASKGHTEIVGILVDAKADVNLANKVRNLHSCSCGPFFERFITRVVIAGMRVRRQDGKTPLYVATHGGHLSTMKVLLEAKADIDRRSDSDGFTPIYTAASSGKTEAVELLIQNGANVNLANTLVQSTLITSDHSSPFTDLTTACQLQKNDGGTPLMIAVVQERLEVVKLLVSAPDININAKDKGKATAFLKAKSKTNGAPRATLWCSQDLSGDIFKLLLANGGKV